MRLSNHWQEFRHNIVPGIVKVVCGSTRLSPRGSAQLLRQCHDEIRDQQRDRRIKLWRQFVNLTHTFSYYLKRRCGVDYRPSYQFSKFTSTNLLNNVLRQVFKTWKSRFACVCSYQFVFYDNCRNTRVDIAGWFSLSISGWTPEFMIYAMRKRARADSLTICNRKKS